MNEFRLKPGFCVRLLVIVSAVLVLAACSSNEVDPDDLPAELVKFKKTLKIKKVWSTGVGDDTENLRLALRPVTDGTRLYGASHDGRLVALDPLKGRKLWKSKTKLPLSGGPGTNGKIVVAGSSDGDLIAVDAQNGDELWRISVTSEVLSTPAVGRDATIVRTVNGKLAAFDNDTGEQLWSIQQSNPRLTVRGTASPVLTRNLVISGFDNGRVAAYSVDEGNEVWDVLMDMPSGRSEIERLADVNSAVQVAGADVYAVSYQGRLGAVAIDTGRLLWTRELSSYSGLAVDLSSIYVTDQRSELVAMSRGSGRELWRKKDIRNRDVSAPAVLGGSVVVGDYKGYLHWFDKETGDLQARVRAGHDRITSQPLVLNDILYVMSDNGRMYAYRIKAPK